MGVELIDLYQRLEVGSGRAKLCGELKSLSKAVLVQVFCTMRDFTIVSVL